MNTVRAFIAIPIEAPPPLRCVCQDLARMGHPVRAVAVEDLHLTLRFLGETSLDQIRPVCRAIRAAGGGRSTLNLRGLGAFPHPRRPRSIWVAVAGAGAIGAMVQALEAPLEALGWPPEGRPWKAHLTVGRIHGRATTGLIDWLAGHQATRFGQVTATAVALMHSQTARRGARYVPLETMALK